MAADSAADGGSEPGGSDNDRDWLLLLLLSLLNTDDWLLPGLWMGLEARSSSGCFFWTSGRRDGREKHHHTAISTVNEPHLSCHEKLFMQ